MTSRDGSLTSSCHATAWDATLDAKRTDYYLLENPPPKKLKIIIPILPLVKKHIFSSLLFFLGGEGFLSK